MKRRDFLKASGMAMASGFGQSSTDRSTQTPVLDIGYVESGNATGFPIVLLHGFVKKTRKTPKEDRASALQRKNAYLKSSKN